MNESAAIPPKKIVLKPLLFILAVMAVPAVIIVGFLLAESTYDKSACQSNLTQVAVAIRMYADEHGGQYPDSFRTILLHEPISSSAFICPRTNQSPAIGPTTRDKADDLSSDHISYEYRAGEFSKTTVKPADVLVYEPLANHGDGLHVLYGDGHVAWIPAADAPAFLQAVQPRRK